ncbi:uncharacterized protein [Dysidea avara]|uniref:uncharacterized protein n=1 Tax=Dysidea avara TaxID=196820 RepID=UPI0033240B8F
MTSLSVSEEALRQKILDLFKEKCSGNAGGAVIPLKDIVRETKAEKRAINKVLHNSPHHFTKVQDSPPHWKCTVDLGSLKTVQATDSAASNITTSTPEDGNDVVVSKEAAAVESPSKKEQLKPQVLAVLNDSPKSMKALEVAKKIGYQTAGDVNPSLYALKEEGKVVKVQDGWSIEGAVIMPDISPMMLDEKELFTHEEIPTADGRKEYRLRQVLPEDLTPPRKTGSATGRDTTDGKQAPPELNPETLSLLSSMFDDTNQYSQALKIVKLLRESVDKTVDDGDILTDLNYSTRQEYRPILEALKLNHLVKKIEGDIIKWKWIADPRM